MPDQKCSVCGNTQALNNKASFHRFPNPKEIDRRTLWIDVFGIQEKYIKPSRVFSRHFPDGYSKKAPSLNLDTYQHSQYRIPLLINCVNK